MFDTRPQPGQQLSLELSDQGRASLAEQLGPGILEVEGTLREIQNDQYVLGVSRVTTIANGTANWGGERVRIPVSDVSRSSLRSLSRGRTALLIGAGVASVVALVLTRSINGSGFVSPQDTTSGPPAGTTRIPVAGTIRIPVP
jgi:hypothetical protein